MPQGLPTPPLNLDSVGSTGRKAVTEMSFEELGVETTSLNTAPGVDLTSHQRLLVGSVLDLFAGLPSLQKLSLWTDNATFADPLTNANGRKQYSAQWYGLKAAFSEIERLNHEVKSNGNPISIDLKTRYKVKGIGKEQVIESVVNVHTNEEGKIVKVDDKWNNEIPEGPIAKVSQQFASGEQGKEAWSFGFWEVYAEEWVFWCWSLLWGTWVWEVSAPA